MSHKSSLIPLWHRALALVLALSTALSPVVAAAAAPTIPGFYGKVPLPGAPAAGTLPVVLPGSTPVGATVGQPVGNTLTVTQTQSQAVIDWKSFNIAPDSIVLFSQKKDGAAQPQWAALNRIYDSNPSLIFGKLKADGKVYLINRNGILFGPGSQVNVHSLVASNLNITDANFQNGKLRFTTDPYDASQGALDAGKSYVSNYGSIATDSGGSIFLVGPNVVNAGTISSPSGKIDLIAAKGAGEVEVVELTADATGNDVTYSSLQVPGVAYNAEGGKLITEAGGRIGMYGATVQNDGLIRAVTALKKGGVVFLQASDKISTGTNSVIETPVDASAETAGPSFTYNPGVVSLNGVYTVSEKAGESDKLTPLSLIEHQGAIIAPAGTVSLTAQDRIYLGEGSSIEVSGLWLDRAASDNLIQVQLNSVYLRDDYGQKSGVLLGQRANVDLLTGSNIGDLSSYYQGVEKSAQQRSTAGGSILFGDTKDGEGSVVLGELIVKEGARLDFAGGGNRYASGTMDTSRLIAGNRLYDMASAPQWVQYDRVADSQVRTSKAGVTREFNGLFFGGGSSVQDLTAARVAGSDAGSVQFKARVMALDGTLNGSVTRGAYQSAVTSRYLSSTQTSGAADSPDYKISVVRGLEEPMGGAVTIGNELTRDISSEATYKGDAVVDSITVKSETAALGAGFGVNTPLERTGTEISAALLNQAGLSAVNLYANTGITTEAGAGLSLLAGGSYTARARRIEFDGSIDIAGGKVEMTTRPNITSEQKYGSETNDLYREVTETIRLGGSSRISVAGERIDNSAPATTLHAQSPASHTAGGTILIQERSVEQESETSGGTSKGHSLVIASGALLDVSGGWSINNKGAIAGADAGTLDLKGATLSLGGDLRGFSLPGKKGGEIRLAAGEIEVTQRDLFVPGNTGIDDTVPAYLQGKLVLGQDRLKETGFTRIILSAANDIRVEDGALMVPSLVKSELPVSALAAQGTATGNKVVPAGYDPANPDYLGATSLTLVAGSNFRSGTFANSGKSIANDNARLSIDSGSSLQVAPGGKISLTGPAIEIAGAVEALGGTVSVTATKADLVLKNGGEILAGGYLKPLPGTAGGLPAGSAPQAGGVLALTSSNGSIVLENGSRVDVSGSAPAERPVAGEDGAPVSVTVAGDPGTLRLNYAGELTLEGEIDGAARMAGVRGGTLSVTNTTKDLHLKEGDLELFLKGGFDDLTFASSVGFIVLPQHLDAAIGRSLTLDAKQIVGAADGEVTLRAPDITLTNTGTIASDAPGSLESGTGRITLSGGYLEVDGSVLVKGAGEVDLRAAHDIYFTDSFYGLGEGATWQGALGVTGNLTLQAARIYPTSMSEFTVASKGKVTILPGATPDGSPVYSAGGNLTIRGEGGVEHGGNLVAPMGTITLDGGANGRVYLAEGSNIATAGTTAVSYGSYDGTTWRVKDKVDSAGGVLAQGPEVTEAPANGITLTGKEVVVRQGATQDISGGGSVYAALFQPGIPGSVNPLTKSGRYVIMPDNSIKLPGHAVYLDAAPELGLKAGVYSVLPAEYAFLPGALVVEKTGLNLTPGQRALSTEGYRVVAGYETVADTSIGTELRTGYSIRTAGDLLKEGDFTVKGFTAGNGGDFTLKATGGAFYAGTLTEKALAGFKGGTLSFSAKNVLVRENADPLAAGFAFDTSLAGSAGETLQLAAGSISDRAVGELRLGDAESTSSVTVQNGAALRAPSLTLSARDAVTIETGAEALALGGTDAGIASIVAATGTFALEQGGVLRASHGVRLDVGASVLNGELSADNGSMTLAANRIVFADSGATQGGGALYLTKSLWDQYALYDDLTLVSRSDMEFQRSVELATAGSLTLDAARYLGSAGAQVSLTAGSRLMLLNSGATSTVATPSSDATASLTLKAAEIVVAPRALGGNGNIVFDSFGKVALHSTNDLVLKGAGTLKTGGDLVLSAARVTTSYDRHDKNSSIAGDVALPYTAADIALAAGGAVSIEGNGGTAGSTVTPGGSLEIAGASITVGNTKPVLDANGAPLLGSDGKPVFNATLVEVPSGQLRLSATGDIVVTGETGILAQGSKSAAPMQTGVYSYGPGGSITLESKSGAVNLAEGSTLDVSAAGGGDADAGTIRLSAAQGGVTLGGAIRGSAATGHGGSFAIDSKSLDGAGGLDGLSTALAAGGLDQRIDIRSRSGNLDLAAGNNLTGREVVLAADGGAIKVSGKIDADGKDAGDAGGRVELYGGTGLTLAGGSVITARGASGGDGGTVLLSSAAKGVVDGDYALKVASGAQIDVKGGAGAANGTVSLRAYQVGGNDVNAALAAGAITNAARVSVEAARRYDGVSAIGDATPYLADAEAFMQAAAATPTSLKSRLFGAAAGDARNHLQAGIEIASGAGADLTLDTAWNLAPATANARPGGEAGVLTLRSGGNLNISQSIVDAPTSVAELHSEGALNESWGLNLVAGAGSAGGANYKAAEAGSGDLTVALGKVVYTENAAISFAAGRDANLKGWSGTAAGPGYMVNGAMKYNMGSYGGEIRGTVGNDLNLKSSGAAIQTAVGDIDLRVAGNVDLGSNAVNSGAIRTTGEYLGSDGNGSPAQVETMPGSGKYVDAGTTSYWTYQGGGDIRLDVAGALQGSLGKDNGWDGAYVDPSVGKVDKISYPWYLAAGFSDGKGNGDNSDNKVAVGIATMGGGDITLRTGGSLKSQVGAFGKGDLTVDSGGDMIGRFRVMNGSAQLASGGGFGRDDAGNPTYRSVIEMGSARVTVAAQGDVHLGAVLNPDNSRDQLFFGSTARKFWNLTYDQGASASVTSLAGDATLYGTDEYRLYTDLTTSTNSYLADRKKILPATFSMAAAGDLNVENAFSLAPSASGNLGLRAGGDISGAVNLSSASVPSSITMADVDLVADFYGRQQDGGSDHSKKLFTDSVPSDSLNAHSHVNHTGDGEPVTVAAGNDIASIRLVLNKEARITAGKDIKRLDLIGQNNSTSGVTLVSAEGSIDQGITGGVAKKVDDNGSLSYSSPYPEIAIGGPGTLLVQARGDINLGDSRGIQSIGNLMNRGFSGNDTDSDIIVSVGAKTGLDPAAAGSSVNPFFKVLDDKGKSYSELKGAGKDDDADREIEAARAEIGKYFDLPSASAGSLTMVDSEISSGKGNIHLMTRGDLNVGKTALQDPTKARANNGINTTFGGGIDIYAGGDVNVNESRVMTFMGGNMTIWSDHGDINAGRGSKTTVSSAGQNDYKYDVNGNIVSIIFKVPAVGSGLRALTYDPDGSSGPLVAPQPGDIHAYAPNGIIDAGEAGIVGGNIILVAPQVVDPFKTISAASGLVGAPSSESSISLGSLAGNSNLADSSKMMESAAGLGAAKEKTAQQAGAGDDFFAKWLDLKIISFEGDNQDGVSDDEARREKERKGKGKK